MGFLKREIIRGQGHEEETLSDFTGPDLCDTHSMGDDYDLSHHLGGAEFI